MNKLLRATELSHLLLENVLQEGHVALDATAGNGYDTLFLAQHVGPSGKVYAFDIQAQALEKAQELIARNNCSERVKFILDSHAKLQYYVKEEINCLVYNLGYLPGGNKNIITTENTSLASLRQGLELLTPGGVLSIIVYCGHPGGDQEAQAVEEFLQGLEAPPWNVLSWKRVNGSPVAPYLLFAQKQG